MWASHLLWLACTASAVHVAFIAPPASHYASMLPIAHGLLDEGHVVSFLAHDETVRKIEKLVPQAKMVDIGPSSMDREKGCYVLLRQRLAEEMKPDVLCELYDSPLLLLETTAVRIHGFFIERIASMINVYFRYQLGHPRPLEVWQFDAVLQHPAVITTLPEPGQRRCGKHTPLWREMQMPAQELTAGRPTAWSPYTPPVAKNPKKWPHPECRWSLEKVMAWLDEQQLASRQVLYVAFGSEVRLSKEHATLLVETFKQGGFTVLWASKVKPDVPIPENQNVLVTKFAPQRAVLAHPAVFGFLSHGGMNSVNEALASGKPLAIMPFFADQMTVAVVHRDLGVAVILDKHAATPTTSVAAIRKIATEPFRRRSLEIKELNEQRRDMSRAVQVIVNQATGKFYMHIPPCPSLWIRAMPLFVTLLFFTRRCFQTCCQHAALSACSASAHCPGPNRSRDQASPARGHPGLWSLCAEVAPKAIWARQRTPSVPSRKSSCLRCRCWQDRVTCTSTRWPVSEILFRHRRSSVIQERKDFRKVAEDISWVFRQSSSSDAAGTTKETGGKRWVDAVFEHMCVKGEFRFREWQKVVQLIQRNPILRNRVRLSDTDRLFYNITHRDNEVPVHNGSHPKDPQLGQARSSLNSPREFRELLMCLADACAVHPGMMFYAVGCHDQALAEAEPHRQYWHGQEHGVEEMNIPVDDADATVHRLYAPGGEAVQPIREAFGDGVLAEDGSIDRKSLSKLVENKQKLQELEAIVHPLVEAARDEFIAEATRRSEPLCILDIPLLFEKHLDSASGMLSARFEASFLVNEEQHCDLVVVVSAPAEQQRARVLARTEMDPDKFTAILAKQVPDVEKRIRADRIVDTGLTLEEKRETKAQVVAFIEECHRQMTQERQRDRTLYWLLLGAALAMGLDVEGDPGNAYISKPVTCAADGFSREGTGFVTVRPDSFKAKTMHASTSTQKQRRNYFDSPMARRRGLVFLLAAPLWAAAFVSRFATYPGSHLGRAWKVALRATGDLVAAAGAGNAEQVADLLRSGTAPDAVDSNGQRPLIAAAGQGHLKVMEHLLEAGADVNAVNQQNATALIAAAFAGGIAPLRVLLAAGANVEAPRRYV
eukprot:s862_g4.t1